MIGVGKIHDIFCGEGITKTYHSESSVHGMEQTIDVCKEEFTGLCFVNLVDFDALWGHRRNVEGYGKEIEKFDEKLGVLLECLSQDDLLILTADHGMIRHTRERIIRESMFLSLHTAKECRREVRFRKQRRLR